MEDNNKIGVKRRPLPEQSRLKELFDYGPMTGFLIRKISVRGACVGTRAGCVDKANGHRCISIDGVIFREANVIWKWVTGNDPYPHIVDHEDVVPDNNKWENLRLATGTQNNANCRARSRNLLGIKGVYERYGRFCAQIKGPEGKIWLGTFDTIDEARSVHSAKAREIYGQFARAA